MDKSKKVKGFTLVELLVVIGVVAVLSVVTVMTINPAELLAQSRDSVRLGDMAGLDRAINILSVDQSLPALPSSRIYISIPDAGAPVGGRDCGSAMGLIPPTGWTYWCRNATEARSTTGNGWIPFDFSAISSGAPFPALPVDPVNSAASSLYYAYVPGVGSYTVTAKLESRKFIRSSSWPDGGTDPGRIEKGNTQLWAQASGLRGYWKFDETSGATAFDSSSYGHNASIIGGTWLSAGQVGGAFDISDGAVLQRYAEVANTPNLYFGDTLTIAGWIYRTNLGSTHAIWSDDGANAPDLYEILLRLPNNSTQATLSSNSGSEQVVTFSAGVAAGAWTHLAVTWDGTNTRMYVNGALVNTQSFAYAPAANIFNTPYRMGREPDGGSQMRGYLDEIRVYDVPLSTAEVQALYAATQ